MKLPGLFIALALILTLLPRTKGEGWSINVTRHVHATLGSDVTIQCSFTFPSNLSTDRVQVYWKKNATTFVFHANGSQVLEMYRGKTKLIGNKDQGNCSLLIQNIREADQHIYLRIIANGAKYSFLKDRVNITLSEASDEWTITIACVATLVSVALVAIFLAGGTFWRLKRKRTIAVTRGDSRRFANVTGTLSDQAKRRDPSQEQESKMLPDVQEINEPIYINMEVPPEQMSQRTAHAESIYENVNNQMLAGCYS